MDLRLKAIRVAQGAFPGRSRPSARWAPNVPDPQLRAREDAEPGNPPSEASDSVRRTSMWKRRFDGQCMKAVEGGHVFTVGLNRR